MLQYGDSDQNLICVCLWTSSGQENTSILEGQTTRSVEDGHTRESTDGPIHIFQYAETKQPSANAWVKSLCSDAISFCKLFHVLWNGHWAALLLFSCSNWWFQLNRKGQHWQTGHRLIHFWGCNARSKGFMSSYHGQELELRLHLSVSRQTDRPSRDCWSSASSHKDKEHRQWQWAEGRKDGSQLQVGAEERVIITPCAGFGEERKESDTARGGTSPSSSGKAFVQEGWVHCSE